MKATSFSISICMFVGCYLLVLFLPLLLLEVQPIKHSKASGTIICTALVFLSTLGLPFSLIFATIVLKMLRVYLIFNNPVSYKKKLFSDRALLLYILLILSPSILTLIMMQLLDTFTESEEVFHLKSYDLVYHGCSNEHTIVWILILLTYNLCLATALVILALKSSKIRFRNFRDKPKLLMPLLSLASLFLS